MILTGSRYAGQPVVAVTVDPTGRTNLAVFRSPPGRPPTFVYYRVLSGDRMDTLAYRFLGRSDLWWILADANPEVIYPDALVSGSIIRVPT
jgi:hypothetical protein